MGSMLNQWHALAKLRAEIEGREGMQGEGGSESKKTEDSGERGAMFQMSENGTLQVEVFKY